jgi:hypothetical protein
VLVSPWVKQGFDSTPFDHASLLRYLVDKWKLDDLGRRVAQANSIGPLLTGPHRPGLVDWIGLSQDQLRPPDPDLEEDAVAYLSSHHRALALIGQHLVAELDEVAPRVFSWFARLIEAIKNIFIGKPTTSKALVSDYETAKMHCQTFLDKRKRQAVPKLAAMVRDPNLPEHIRQHAAETLGHAVNRRFQRQQDPARAAQHWLQRHAM